MDLDRVDRTRYTFVGPVIGDRSHEESFADLATRSDRPLLLVSLGSAYNDRPAFWRDCITAMHARHRLDNVLAVGPYVDVIGLGDIPDDVIVRERVPQLAVLAHASAFVTHAGMGGCSEGLWHGVPMVAVPQAADQFVNGPRRRSPGPSAGLRPRPM